MDLQLTNKVVLITGAAQGIGRAGVMRFLQEGAIVYAADVNSTRLQELHQSLSTPQLKTLQLNVTDEASVADGVARITAAEGRLDVLFHNAMSAEYVNNHDRCVTELATDVWINIRTLVLDGTFHCLKHVGRAMVEQQRGAIILTSTVDALIGCPGFDAYVAAKGAIVALVRSTAASLSPQGVRVNSIAPGFVKTPAQMGFIDDPALKKLHLFEVAEPDDIADLALFLASDRARVITGTTIVADSGYACFKGDVDRFRQMVVSSPAKENTP
jgi:NAD(P)-dependent dehydrogenase (short-subunit alcohol dehydrogenase family)